MANKQSSDWLGRERIKHELPLDGLRGCAVTLVVLSHLFPWAIGGWSGVDIFFVLSGFLITRLLTVEITLTSRVDLLGFYFRRCLRLMPAFYLMLLVYGLWGVTTQSGPERIMPLKAIVWSGIYAMSWVTALGHGVQGAVGHTWSLAIEEQFYLLWPVALIFTPSRWRLPAALLLLSTSAIWRCTLVYGWHEPLRRAYFGFDTRAEALLWGCVIALLPSALSPGRPIPRALGKLWLLPVLGFIAITGLVDHEVSTDANGIGLTVTALLASWLLLAAREPNQLGKILSTDAIVYVGRISYGIYLWHYPLLVFANSKSIAVNSAVVASSIAVASLSFHFVERPFLKLKRLRQSRAPRTN